MKIRDWFLPRRKPTRRNLTRRQYRLLSALDMLGGEAKLSAIHDKIRSITHESVPDEPISDTLAEADGLTKLGILSRYGMVFRVEVKE
jgi:hypothetical protein